MARRSLQIPDKFTRIASPSVVVFPGNFGPQLFPIFANAEPNLSLFRKAKVTR